MSEWPSVTCPQCGILLRKVEVEPGRPTRCTNCGHTFQVAAACKPTATAPPTPAATPLPEKRAPDAAPARDEDVPAPRAHYGYLRIAGFLLMAATLTGSTVVTARVFFPWLYALSGHLDRSWLPGLVIGLPLLGVVCFLITLRVGWLDGQVHRRAAILNARVRPMPTPHGSDLPYILPWMVSGAVAVIVPLALLIAEEQPSMDLQITVAVGVVLFAMGLALGELRRFLARLSWAEDCVTQAQPRQEAPVAVIIRMGLELLTPYTMLAAALLAGILFAAELKDAIREDDGIRTCLFSALTLATIGGAYSLYRLSKNLVVVVAKGERLARLVNLSRTGTPFIHQHAGFVFCLALAFSLWGWGPLLKSLWGLISRDPPHGWLDELPGLSRFTGVLIAAVLWSAAIWLGGLLLLLHRATRSMLGLVESTVPPREAWSRPAFLPHGVGGWTASILMLVSLANFVACIAALLWGPRVLADQPMLAGSLLFLFIVLVFAIAGTNESRPGCLVFVYLVLTILIFLGALPTTPDFLLPIAGSLVGAGMALLVLDVERVAERIEATS